MANKDTLEAHYQIFDEAGDKALTVGPDSDGLELVELNQGGQRITLTVNQARLAIKALERLASDLEVPKE